MHSDKIVEKKILSCDFKHDDIKQFSKSLQVFIKNQKQECEYKIKHFVYDSCFNAAANGYLDCFRYNYENMKQIKTNDTKTCTIAAKNRHLNCLEYAHKNGFKWDYLTSNAAAESGDLNCLVYCLSNNCQVYLDDKHKNIIDSLLIGKSIECLDYLFNIFGKKIFEKYLMKIIELNYSDFLEYLCNNGFELTSKISEYAAFNNSYECFVFAISNKCPLSYNVYQQLKYTKEYYDKNPSEFTDDGIIKCYVYLCDFIKNMNYSNCDDAFENDYLKYTFESNNKIESKPNTTDNCSLS